MIFVYQCPIINFLLKELWYPKHVLVYSAADLEEWKEGRSYSKVGEEEGIPGERKKRLLSRVTDALQHVNFYMNQADKIIVCSDVQENLLKDYYSRVDYGDLSKHLRVLYPPTAIFKDSGLFRPPMLSAHRDSLAEAIPKQVVEFVSERPFFLSINKYPSASEVFLALDAFAHFQNSLAQASTPPLSDQRNQGLSQESSLSSPRLSEASNSPSRSLEGSRLTENLLRDVQEETFEDQIERYRSLRCIAADIQHNIEGSTGNPQPPCDEVQLIRGGETTSIAIPRLIIVGGFNLHDATQMEVFRRELERLSLDVDDVKLYGDDTIGSLTYLYLLSKCLCVIHTPKDINVVKISAEACWAGRPVIQCAAYSRLDPVRHEFNGYTCDRDAEKLAGFLKALYFDKAVKNGGKRLLKMQAQAKQAAYKFFSTDAFQKALCDFVSDQLAPPARGNGETISPDGTLRRRREELKELVECDSDDNAGTAEQS